MAYYSSPEEMFLTRAENFKRSGSRHWAMAKNGEDRYHYGKAKVCFTQEQNNRARATHAKKTGATWSRKK